MTMRKIELTQTHELSGEKKVSIEPSMIAMYAEFNSTNNKSGARSVVMLKPNCYKLYVKENHQTISGLISSENDNYLERKETLRQKYINANKAVSISENTSN